MRLSEAQIKYKQEQFKKIKKEYSKGDTSIAKLSEKYKISKSHLLKILKAEVGYLKQFKGENLYANRETQKSYQQPQEAGK